MKSASKINETRLQQRGTDWIILPAAGGFCWDVLSQRNVVEIKFYTKSVNLPDISFFFLHRSMRILGYPIK